MTNNWRRDLEQEAADLDAEWEAVVAHLDGRQPQGLHQGGVRLSCGPGCCGDPGDCVEAHA